MSGLDQRIHDAVHGQTQPTVTVLSSLLAVEDELGYVPKEAVDFVAGFSKTTVNDVWAVASFYPNFRFQPPAEHVVEVCWGASCHLVGAMGVFESFFAAKFNFSSANTSSSCVQKSRLFTTSLSATAS